jgi:hypothetical protein
VAYFNLTREAGSTWGGLATPRVPPSENSTKELNYCKINKGGQRGHNAQRKWAYYELMATNELRPNDYFYIFHLASLYGTSLQFQRFKRQNRIKEVKSGV